MNKYYSGKMASECSEIQYSGTSLNGHSLYRTPHYTGQNIAVRIEFALRVILNNYPKCRHLAIP